MRCPFFPTCEADLEPIEQKVRIGSDDVEYVYPIHQVEGPEAWFGGCPASHFLILPGGQLTEQAQQVLRDATRTYLRMALTRAGRAQNVRRAGQGLPVTGDIPLPSPERPERPVEESFPGRPADGPEPGPGEAPAQNVEIGTGHHLGKGDMDNARDTLKGLTELAITQMEQARDVLARADTAMEEAAALAVAAEHQAQSASALVAAAIGAEGATTPEAATGMRQHIVAAASKLGSSDGPAQTISSAQTRTSEVLVHLSSAIEYARAYHALP